MAQLRAADAMAEDNALHDGTAVVAKQEQTLLCQGSKRRALEDIGNTMADRQASPLPATTFADLPGEIVAGIVHLSGPSSLAACSLTDRRRRQLVRDLRARRQELRIDMNRAQTGGQRGEEVYQALATTLPSLYPQLQALHIRDFASTSSARINSSGLVSLRLFFQGVLRQLLHEMPTHLTTLVLDASNNHLAASELSAIGALQQLQRLELRNLGCGLCLRQQHLDALAGLHCLQALVITAAPLTVNSTPFISTVLADGLPRCLPAMTQLTQLRVSDLGVQDLPEGFAKLQALRHLDLSRCSFNTIPEQLLALPKLGHLNMCHNPRLLNMQLNMQNHSPDELQRLGKLSQVQTLVMDTRCPCPDTAGAMKLQELHLHGGPQHLPAWLPLAATLLRLHLHSCSGGFVGDGPGPGFVFEAVPREVLQLRSLQELHVTDLERSTLCCELSALTGLTLLSFKRMRRFGMVASALSNMPQLRVLQLADCGLGVLPKSVAVSQLSGLIALDLSHNRMEICPPIPVDLPNLEVLCLANFPHQALMNPVHRALDWTVQLPKLRLIDVSRDDGKDTGLDEAVAHRQKLQPQGRPLHVVTHPAHRPSYPWQPQLQQCLATGEMSHTA